ncbi:hypothetical protein [Moorena sp. SIO4G3]|uniref:hypothetical protein n=1 Tax=Moorena sp. SIO4G3 TaxID=2607821 RepID=UPI001429E063|nr:hypothetical protein [Moorena sp. SIO4G3]NEO76403.1 hypothetical protein [Moorena sp. SIO4G3]
MRGIARIRSFYNRVNSRTAPILRFTYHSPILTYWLSRFSEEEECPAYFSLFLFYNKILTIPEDLLANLGLCPTLREQGY